MSDLYYACPTCGGATTSRYIYRPTAEGGDQLELFCDACGVRTTIDRRERETMTTERYRRAVAGGVGPTADDTNHFMATLEADFDGLKTLLVAIGTAMTCEICRGTGTATEYRTGEIGYPRYEGISSRTVECQCRATLRAALAVVPS